MEHTAIPARTEKWKRRPPRHTDTPAISAAKNERCSEADTAFRELVRQRHANSPA